MKSEKEPSQGGYKPLFTLDILKCSAAQFEEVKDAMEKHRKSLGSLPPINKQDGWYVQTPQDCEQFLLRNPKGANRDSTLQTVRYYAQQMVAGDWSKTGEAIIYTSDGVGINGGNRNWAGYLSGCSFDTYMIFSVPPKPNIFAYIDNVKPRTPATALQTAGYDGISPLISGLVHIKQGMDAGAYSMQRVARVAHRLSPIEVLRIVQNNPKFRDVAHLTAGEYNSVIERLRYRDVAAFLAYEILNKHGEIVLDEFMQELGSNGDQLPEGTAISAFHKWLDHESRKIKRSPKHIVLAYAIHTFNMWRLGKPVKKTNVPADAAFPVIIDGDGSPEPEVAEAE